jgi:hypothetical protein
LKSKSKYPTSQVPVKVGDSVLFFAERTLAGSTQQKSTIPSEPFFVVRKRELIAEIHRVDEALRTNEEAIRLFRSTNFVAYDGSRLTRRRWGISRASEAHAQLDKLKTEREDLHEQFNLRTG